MSPYTLLLVLICIGIAVFPPVLSTKARVRDENSSQQGSVPIRLKIRIRSAASQSKLTNKPATSVDKIHSTDDAVRPICIRLKKRTSNDPLFRHRLGGGLGQPRGHRSGRDRSQSDEWRRTAFRTQYQKMKKLIEDSMRIIRSSDDNPGWDEDADRDMASRSLSYDADLDDSAEEQCNGTEFP